MGNIQYSADLACSNASQNYSAVFWSTVKDPEANRSMKLYKALKTRFKSPNAIHFDAEGRDLQTF